MRISLGRGQVNRCEAKTLERAFLKEAHAVQRVIGDLIVVERNDGVVHLELLEKAYVPRTWIAFDGRLEVLPERTPKECEEVLRAKRQGDRVVILFRELTQRVEHLDRAFMLGRVREELEQRPTSNDSLYRIAVKDRVARKKKILVGLVQLCEKCLDVA